MAREVGVRLWLSRFINVEGQHFIFGLCVIIYVPKACNIMEVLKSESDLVYGVTRNLDNAKTRLHNDVTKGDLLAEVEKTILRFL